MPALVLLLFCTSSLLLGACILLLVKRAALQAQQCTSKERLEAAEKTIADTQAKNNSQAIREARLTTLLENERKHAAEKLQLLEDAREELRLQFSSLAQRIFDEKSARFSELNRDKLDAILQPFNNQLTALKQEITEIYRHDSRERFSLKNEIVQLRDLNQQINQEAINLTRALKSDTKMQGNWGELVLERVLEQSGLRRGLEYDTQGGFRDNNNRLLKPDVLVHLPEGKDIIIDSKVSLVSWEKYVNSDDEERRAAHLTALLQAIREHIHGLSKKIMPS
jgi:DNA recombination protein RmuC